MKEESAASKIVSVLKEVNVGIIRGAIGSLPGIGGYLNEAIFDVRGRIKQKRYESLIAYLHQQVQDLAEKSLDESFIKSEEFVDLFEKVVEKSTKTKHDNKRELYARIITGSLKAGKIDDYDNEMMYIDLIDALTINELIVLKYLSPKEATGKGLSFVFKEEAGAAREARRKFHENHTFEFKAVRLDYYKEQLFELVPVDARIAVEGLIGKSLALDDSPSRIETDPRTYICITPLGNKLINYIAAKLER